jgi:hypothetical protein
VNTWQGFYALKTKDGHRKVNLYQTKASFKRIIDAALEDAFRRFVEEQGGQPIPKSRLPKWRPGQHVSDTPHMITWGIYDAHLGLYAWNSEVETSYDMNIARNRILNSIDDVALELRHYRVQRALIPVGNDFLHCDSTRNQTSFGDHHLDVDTRYAKILTAGLSCMAYQVERTLEFTDEVELIYVPGNHDYHASYALVLALEQRFRNEPRVKVDLGANPRKFRMHGGVLIGFEHGQKCQPKQINTIFSTSTINMFSRSTYREFHVGHKHQRNVIDFQSVIPTNGLVVRVHPSLANIDKWHHDLGLVGEPVKAVEVCRYDDVFLRGTHMAWARDEEVARKKGG